MSVAEFVNQRTRLSSTANASLKSTTSTRNSLSESTHEALDVNMNVGVVQNFTLEVFLLRRVGLKEGRTKENPRVPSKSVGRALPSSKRKIQY